MISDDEFATTIARTVRGTLIKIVRYGLIFYPPKNRFVPGAERPKKISSEVKSGREAPGKKFVREP